MTKIIVAIAIVLMIMGCHSVPQAVTYPAPWGIAGGGF